MRGKDWDKKTKAEQAEENAPQRKPRNKPKGKIIK